MVKTPREHRESYKKRPQNLPFALRNKPRPPRTQKLRTAVQFDKNRIKKPATLAKYRYGYNLAWKIPKVQERMIRIGFKAPGTYGKNQQNGHMFAMPYEVPKRMNDENAGWILRDAFKSRKYTWSQLDAIRAMLSFCYQLQTGEHRDDPKQSCNYRSVKDQWGSQAANEYAPPTKSTKSEVSVEPEGLNKAFNTEWSLQTPMAFMRWIIGLLITWDWSVHGMRSKVDLEKIKHAPEHRFTPSEGWMASKLDGGRSKLPNQTHEREWWCYRTCLCPDGKHKPVPKGWNHPDNLDSKHNPLKVNWCTVCPLNAFQIIRETLAPEDTRTYVKWLESQNRYSHKNLGFPTTIQLAKQWLDIQGANPDKLDFDQNSGRKALGKWCDAFNVRYYESFQLHGDLYMTWKEHYQPGLRKEHVKVPRTQSKNPEEATAALRRFARAIGRGRTIREDPKDFDMTTIGLLLTANLRAMGKGHEVNRILDRHDEPDEQKRFGD